MTGHADTGQSRMLRLLQSRADWVQRSEIAQATGLKPTAITTAASELRAKGFPVVGRNYRHGGGYRLAADG